MVGTGHYTIGAEAIGCLDYPLIVGCDDYAVNFFAATDLLPGVLNEKFAGIFGENFSGKSCRSETSGYAGENFQLNIPVSKIVKKRKTNWAVILKTIRPDVKAKLGFFCFLFVILAFCI